MSNHEAKDYADSVDVYLALSRTKDGESARCMRVVVKRPEEYLFILEQRCLYLGGKWRIHKTVNKRDTEKARKWLLKKLIDFPEGRGFIDSLWRTALLQPECIYGEKKFMLDVDTKDIGLLDALDAMVNKHKLEEIETQHGWHFITRPFDTRAVCELPYVSLQRDGYVYIKTIGEQMPDKTDIQEELYCMHCSKKESECVCGDAPIWGE